MRRLVLILALLAAACSPRPPNDVALEPIIEGNVYDPAITPLPADEPISSGPISAAPITAAPITAAPITPAPISPAPAPAVRPARSDKERLVTAIQAEGCVLNATNSERVLQSLGISNERLGELGGELMKEGRVEVVPPAEFRLIDGPCAS